jgi:hypothetical protein
VSTVRAEMAAVLANMRTTRLTVKTKVGAASPPDLDSVRDEPTAGPWFVVDARPSDVVNNLETQGARVPGRLWTEYDDDEVDAWEMIQEELIEDPCGCLVLLFCNACCNNEPNACSDVVGHARNGMVWAVRGAYCRKHAEYAALVWNERQELAIAYGRHEVKAEAFEQRMTALSTTLLKTGDGAVYQVHLPEGVS